MLFKIRSNPIHLSGALPVPYVPACVTRDALVAHRHSFTPPRCWTSQYRRSFVPLSVSLWNDLSDPVFDGGDWRVSRAEPMLSCWHDLIFLFCLLLFYLFLPSMGWLCGVGVFGLIECPHSLLALHSGLQNNNNNNNGVPVCSQLFWDHHCPCLAGNIIRVNS